MHEHNVSFRASWVGARRGGKSMHSNESRMNVVEEIGPDLANVFNNKVEG